MTMLKRVGTVAVAAMPISQLAGLGLPAVAVLITVPVVGVFGLAAWVADDDRRTDRAVRLIKAVLGRVEADIPVSADVMVRRWYHWRSRRRRSRS